MSILSSRAMRGYRTMTPKKFHSFNQKVYTALSDKTKIPASTWAANPALLENYLATAEKHDAVYHQATYGSPSSADGKTPSPADGTSRQASRCHGPPDPRRSAS